MVYLRFLDLLLDFVRKGFVKLLVSVGISCLLLGLGMCA